MTQEALKLALEALEGYESCIDGYYADTVCPQIDKAITAIKEALAQPEQDTNKNGSPCPEFWDWLPKAYNFEGNGNFTKYNMEVAFLAGKQASQPEQTPYITMPPSTPMWTIPPQRTWVGLMRGVRVEGDTVVISVKGGNDAARELCGALIEEMNR